METVKTVLRTFAVFTLLLGVVYPFFVMGVGKLAFPHQANGSLVERRGKIVGSSLIGQEFSSPKYFHGRYSTFGYNARESGERSVALSSAKLLERTKERGRRVLQKNKLPSEVRLPADMVFDSASGLDPHITVANALFQLPRVAQQRGLPADRVKKEVYDSIDSDFIGIWGQAGVNVLKLNLALDALEK